MAEASSAESEETTEKSGANRLSSVGATIPRPPSESVATASQAVAITITEIVAEKPAVEPEAARRQQHFAANHQAAATVTRNLARAKVSNVAKKTETARIERLRPKPKLRRPKLKSRLKRNLRLRKSLPRQLRLQRRPKLRHRCRLPA